MKRKFWLPIPATLNISEQPKKHQSKFTTEKGSIKTLYGLEQYLLYGKENAQPHKYVKLNFDTKFEVLRLSVQKKSDDDDSLGPGIGILFIRHCGKQILTYRINATEQFIIEWKSFLSSKINQWQFHHLFRVFKKIGKGSFASVFMAQRIEDGEMFAVKALTKDAAYSEENGKEAIINELQIMRQLDNSHLMKLHEVYETHKSIYMVLELLRGGSLKDLLQEKKSLRIKQIQQILAGVLVGLNDMHQKGMMHRDLKLENILFKVKGKVETVVIADFGLATFVNEPEYLFTRCGTPGYVAPEILNQKNQNQKYSAICDIYSLGLVYFFLLTGRAAFPSKTYKSLIKQNREAVIDFTIKQLQLVPGEALSLLMMMLEKEPNFRIAISKCMKHPFVKDTIDLMLEVESEESDIDQIDEGIDVGFLANKMQQQYDVFDASRNLNSPTQSSILIKVSKQYRQIDSSKLLQACSPLFSGRIDTIQSIGNFNLMANSNQMSPIIKSSKYAEKQIRQNYSTQM